MALSKDAYQEMEGIVGPDNISDDPIILDTYAFQNNAEVANQDQSKFMPRCTAIVLPGSTEEVQGIVKTCNKYRIKYKAHSTGWGAVAVPAFEGAILLDLRRMDRILEIDERNMFAVVEPYVIAGTLQAEAMKVGLNAHMIGAGSASSVLAQATSLWGAGPDSISMGYAPQNVLAIEWVMPTGEVLRTGSLGSGAGWFCGEGPGPSVRGIIRGYSGAAGGMGVFTKCAVKLHPWLGPPVLPVEGTTPAYNSPLPENLRVYTLAFPTWQALADAFYKIYDAEIGYILHRQFQLWGSDLAPALMLLYADHTKTIDDLEEMLKTPEIQELTEEMKISFQLVLAGNSRGHIEYQEKVLSQILRETNGTNVAAMATPTMQRYIGLYLIKMCFKLYNWVLSGGYRGSFMHPGTPDWCISYVPWAVELKKKHIEKGGIVDDGGDAFMGAGALLGGGGYHYLEMFAQYDPHSKESINAVKAYLSDYDQVRKERRLGLGVGGQGGVLRGGRSKEEHEVILLTAPQPATWDWQRKIKEAFDPNDIGDGSYAYLSQDKTKS